MNFYFGYKSIELVDCEVIGKRNFSGREVVRNGRTVNSDGRRNFLVKLTPEQFDILNEKGWDVGRFAAPEPGVEPDCFLRVNISYYKEAPEIHYISDGVDTLLDEDHVRNLDFVNFERLDIRAAEVNKQRQDGTWVKKPFVNTMWATVTADRFAAYYAHLKPAQSQEQPEMGAFEDDGDAPF